MIKWAADSHVCGYWFENLGAVHLWAMQKTLLQQEFWPRIGILSVTGKAWVPQKVEQTREIFDYLVKGKIWLHGILHDLLQCLQIFSCYVVFTCDKTGLWCILHRLRFWKGLAKRIFVRKEFYTIIWNLLISLILEVITNINYFISYDNVSENN